MSAPAAAHLVSALAAARKAVQLYPDTHPKHVEALEGLVRAVDEAAAAAGGGADPVALNVYQGRLYRGSDVLDDDIPGAAALAEALESRGIESLAFSPGFSAADAVGVVQALSLKPSPDLDVAAELEKRGVAHVTVAYLAEPGREEAAERDERREELRALYKQAVAALRALHARIAGGQRARLDEATGVADAVLNHLAQDHATMLGLATLRSHGEAGLFHGVNVMIYALELGRAVGLDEDELRSLGVSALLHDIGKALAADLPAEAVYYDHPTVGAEVLAALIAEDSAPMIVAHEHHMAVDGTGFPDRPEGHETHPFSRIVAVADRYENLTKGSNGETALTPDRAVARVLAEAASALDPVYARLFVQTMGVFPVGSVVRLSDHSVGVVSDGGERPFAPVVRLVLGPDGLQVASPGEVDLADDERAIVEVLDPDVLDIEASDHL